MKRMTFEAALSVAVVCSSAVLTSPLSAAAQASPDDGSVASDLVAGEPRRLTTVETLVGTWTGRWEAAGGTSAGSLGVVLSRVPGRDTVIGQFTFVNGALSQTVRYEGFLEDGVVRFPLVDRGRIVLETDRETKRPLTAGRLSGMWVDSRGALPASRGTMELERAS